MFQFRSTPTRKGLSTNAPPCSALCRAALRRALRLVNLVADWLIPEVLTNQRQSLVRNGWDTHGSLMTTPANVNNKSLLK